MTNEEFEEYLDSIGGLVNGYYTNRPNITSNMCECSDGWLQLIHDLIEELIVAGWNKQICQIKEKFGGLRFYTNGMTDEQHNIVRKYEELSYNTCEVCGEKGKVRNEGWIKTLCDNHIKKD